MATAGEILVAEFIDVLEAHLKDAIGSSKSYFPAYLEGDVVRGWPDAQHAMLQLRQDLRAEKGDERLRDVGLAGAPLAFKVGVFKKAAEGKPKKFGLTLIKWLRRLFRFANVTMGSLAKLFNSAERLKEFKDTLEIGLEETEDTLKE